MVKGIIENTHIISSKVTEFIWFLGYNNFSKINMYFETNEVTFSCISLSPMRSLGCKAVHMCLGTQVPNSKLRVQFYNLKGGHSSIPRKSKLKWSFVSL